MNTYSRSLLTPDNVAEIKQHIWQGDLSQSQIARMYGTTQPTISRIMRGAMWSGVLWPDGNPGPLPLERHQAIIHSKRPDTVPIQGTKSVVTSALANAVADALEGIDDSDSMLEKAARSSGYVTPLEKEKTNG